jgi:hypothetical protein
MQRRRPEHSYDEPEPVRIARTPLAPARWNRLGQLLLGQSGIGQIMPTDRMLAVPMAAVTGATLSHSLRSVGSAWRTSYAQILDNQIFPTSSFGVMAIAV